MLFTGLGEPGSLNHIGVEVETTDEVSAVIARTQAIGMDQEMQENTTCCFAVQDKTWIKGPENDWEFYRARRRLRDVLRRRARGRSKFAVLLS